MFENREACAYYKHHQVGVSCQVLIQDGIRFSVQRQVDVGDVGTSRRSAVGGDFLGVKLDEASYLSLPQLFAEGFGFCERDLGLALGKELFVAFEG